MSDRDENLGHIMWWEVRRFRYNVIVMATALCSFIVIMAIGASLVPPGEDVEEPIGIIVAAVGF